MDFAEQYIKGALCALARTDEDMGELERVYELAEAHKHILRPSDLFDALSSQLNLRPTRAASVDRPLSLACIIDISSCLLRAN
jgi:hypothetical protein